MAKENEPKPKPNTGLTPEALKEAQRIGQLEAALKESEAAVKRLNSQLAKSPKLIEEGAITLKDQTELYKEINEAERKRISNLQSLQAAGLDLAKNQALLNDEEKKLLKTGQTVLEVLNRQEIVLRAQVRGINAIEQQTGNVAKKLGLQREYQTSSLKAIVDAARVEGGLTKMRNMALTNLKSYVNVAEISYKIVTKTLSATIEYNKELISARKNLNKTTGMASQFAGDMDSAAHTFFLYGGSLEEAAGNIGTLVSGFNEFTNTNEKERKRLLKLTAEMSALGISTDDFAASLNFLTKVQGKSVTQSANFTKKIAEYGVSIGRTPSEFVKEFVSATDKLSIYGERMEGIFFNLEKRAKATGVSFDNLISGSDKFRDFSEVTRMIAGLNAQLGRVNLDPMEFLLMDDPDQQLGALRKAIIATGQLEKIRSSSAERALLAKTTGFSDADIMKILSGEFKETNKQSAKWNKLLEKSSSIMDKLDTIGRSMAFNMMPLLDWVDEWLGKFVKSKNAAREFLKAMARGIVIFNTTFRVFKSIYDSFRATQALGLSFAKALKATVTTTKALKSLIVPFGKIFLKAFLPLSILISAFEVLPHLFDQLSDSSTHWGTKLGDVVLGLGQLLLEVFINPFIWLASKAASLIGLEMAEGFNIQRGKDFVKMPTAHTGTTDQKGLVKVQDNELVLGNASGGRDIVTERNKENIETLLAKLDKSINNLASGGKSTEIVLKVNGEVLARQVMKNLKYS